MLNKVNFSEGKIKTTSVVKDENIKEEAIWYIIHH